MLTLNCIDKDNKPHVLYYDHHTSKLFNENNVQVKYGVDKTLQGPFKEAFRVHPELNPGKKVNKIKRLKIQLGLGCNYSCSYCLQAAEIHKASASSLADVNIFLKNLDRWLDPTVLNKIEFWGGEPLLYWHKIKVLVPALREKFPNVKFSTVTNGSLLTKEIADFLYDYDFSFAISHDGPGHHVRGEDMLDDKEIYDNIVYVLKKFNTSKFNKRVSFNAVLTPVSYDVDKIIEWFQNRFANDIEPDNLNVGFEGVVHEYSEDGGLTNNRFTKEQLEELTYNLSRQIISGTALRSGAIYSRMKSALDSFINEIPSSALSQKCGMDMDDQIAVDLLGNVTTCQNVGAKGEHKIGTVYQFEKIALDTAWHWSYKPECRSCPVLQLCKGSCMYQTGDGWVSSCHAEFAFNMAFFIGAIFVLTNGLMLQSITGDIVRPKYSFEMHTTEVDA